MITLTDLATMYALKHEMRISQSKEIIKSVIDIIEDGIIEGGTVQIKNSFTLKKVNASKPYVMSNPATGEPMKVERKAHLSISTGKALSDRLNGD